MAGPTAKPAAAFDPLPADRTQWKKGATYLTNRGPLTWDGSVFTPMATTQ